MIFYKHAGALVCTAAAAAVFLDGCTKVINETLIGYRVRNLSPDTIVANVSFLDDHGNDACHGTFQ